MDTLTEVMTFLVLAACPKQYRKKETVVQDITGKCSKCVNIQSDVSEAGGAVQSETGSQMKKSHDAFYSCGIMSSLHI